MSDVIDWSSGRGQVLQGSVPIADVDYDFQWYEPRNAEGLPLMRKIAIRIVDPPGALNERQTLRMKDGRKLDFWVRSSNGDCAASGAPYLECAKCSHKLYETLDWATGNQTLICPCGEAIPPPRR